MFSVSCRLGQVRVVGLMSAISVRKSSIALLSQGCGFKWNGSYFFSCHHKIFARMTLLICDALGKKAGWTTPSNIVSVVFH